MNIYNGKILPPGMLPSPGDLLHGTFHSRPNRFLVLVETEFAVVKAHCPNPGRLWELFTPNRKLIIRFVGNPDRATPYSLVAAEYNGKILPLYAAGANQITEELIIPELFPDTLRYKREVTIGRSRFDFEVILPLPDGKEKRLLIEVKACTLTEEGLAMFPDAPTERGRRHMEELAELTRAGEAEGHVIFVLHHEDTLAFMPNYHTDPAFALTMAGLDSTLQFHAVSVTTDIEGTVSLVNTALPILRAPIETIENNSGVYMIMFERPEEETIEIGALGSIKFEKGWYVYVGSAMKNLTQRVERHLRKRKNKHWHIDYLIEGAGLKKGIPIYTNKRLECPLAESVAAAADGEVDKFGSTDCNCNSHLYYFSESPLKNKAFVKLIFAYRHKICFSSDLEF